MNHATNITKTIFDNIQVLLKSYIYKLNAKNDKAYAVVILLKSVFLSSQNIIEHQAMC